MYNNQFNNLLTTHRFDQLSNSQLLVKWHTPVKSHFSLTCRHQQQRYNWTYSCNEVIAKYGDVLYHFSGIAKEN